MAMSSGYLQDLVRRGTNKGRRIFGKLVNYRKVEGSSMRAEQAPVAQSLEGTLEFKWMKHDHAFKTIMDIGSNDGEFGDFLRSYFGVNRVIAFEPLTSYREQLEGRGFEVMSIALGDRDGTTSFIVNAEDTSSSVLPVSEEKRASFPQLMDFETIEVPIRRLDSVVEGMTIEDDLLIKLDAEGLEDAIIRGGEQTFKRAQAVIIELSFLPMNDGQALFNEVHVQLADLGFRFTGIKNQLCRISDRRPLFAHCVYQR